MHVLGETGLEEEARLQGGCLNVGEQLVGSGPCGEESWPDKDHGLVCGSCKVLVDNFSSKYKTCDGYCTSLARVCVGAWEEKSDTCRVLHHITCDEELDSSDAICECSEILTPPPETPAPSSGTPA